MSSPVPAPASPVVRLGVVGLGNMGGTHIASILAGKVARCQLAAVCDGDAERTARYPQAKAFSDSKAMIASGAIDAILICTPHFDHTVTGCAALAAGLHVLVEKPLSVHKADCEKLIAAYAARPRQGQVFAAMFNQRTDPHYAKLRELIRTGELGEVRRVNWIVTDWFRSEAYYASSGWRATWKGEGGGVLINQCPHNLDLLQWLFGMPTAVRAFCQFGKWHDIETEDAVTAYLEFPNGATGVFVTSTGETPGTNRLEIAAERGRVVLEGGKLTWTRNVVPMGDFSRTTSESFGRPEVWNVEVPIPGSGGQHNEVLQNFVDAVLDGKPLIAPAVEGIHSVELANSFVHSSVTGATVRLPLDAKAYAATLDGLIAANQGRVKKVSAVKASAADFAKSHGT
jgi:predicted dehydrogenase